MTAVPGAVRDAPGRDGGAAQSPYATARVPVLRLPGSGRTRDEVAVEEPLEIRVGGSPLAVTMRTPGDDEELALGFCLSEGLRPRSAWLPTDLAANTVEVDADLAALGDKLEQRRRTFYTSASCGVCGVGAIDAVAVDGPRNESALRVTEEVVVALPERLRAGQPGFAATGGLHAAGLFTAEGEMLCTREDVGRHNAVDKVVGWAFLAHMVPLETQVICTSGRVSFEIVQKAAMAGCAVIVAVGAPSTLALKLASDRGVTVCGFVRDGRCVVYTEPARVVAGGLSGP